MLRGGEDGRSQLGQRAERVRRPLSTLNGVLLVRFLPTWAENERKNNTTNQNLKYHSIVEDKRNSKTDIVL